MQTNWIARLCRLTCVIALACAGVARAQEVAPPSNNSFELTLGLGYGQGLGPVASGTPRLQDLGTVGGTLEVGAGWRINPNWMLGAYTEISYFDGGKLANSDTAMSLAAGVQGQFHVMPGRRFDPWIGLGAGWRGYWGSLVGTSSDYKLQGVDFARLRIGVDYRVSPTVAVGPVLGLTLTEFLSEKKPGAASYTDTNDRKFNTFVFAGVQGRFDM